MASATLGGFARGGLAFALGAALALPHILNVKPFYNGKTNASTRGSMMASAGQLWMMQPPLHGIGAPEALGFRAMLQDEEASTAEDCDLSFVRYAPDGTSPDETAGGEVLKVRFRVFGFGLSGKQAYDFLLTYAFAAALPASYGIGIGLPAAAAWPADGLSMHGQLNWPGDPLRPRVPAPYDQQVWAFERPPGATQAVSLGGRVLDSLRVTGVHTTSLLQAFVRSSAYGNGLEDLLGPESMHPDAARGDQIGFLVAGNNEANFGLLLLLASLSPAATPLPFPPDPKGLVYLDTTPPFPVLLAWSLLDQHGQGTIGPFPIGGFPSAVRSFWVQGLVLNFATGQQRLTDAAGVRGL